MKKKLVALAALSAIAGAAQAQSSVTLYGIVDVAYRYTTNHGPAVDNGQSLSKVIGGGMSQSRWGVNINEDLGGGLRALANLEQRFTPDNGALNGSGTGQQFQQSWVGLQSSSLGRLTMGRQYNVLFDVTTSTFASFKYSPYIEAYKPEVAMALGVRNDNMVKYTLSLGGFTGELQASAGEGSDTTFVKSMGGMAKYTFGPFAVGGGYLQREGANATTTDLKAESWIIGGAWTSGPIYLSGGYAESSFDQGVPVALFLVGTGADNVFSYTNSPLAGVNVESREMYFVNLNFQVTPALNLGAAYWNLEDTFYSPLSGSPQGDFMAFIAQYAFSKRTDAYVGLDYTKVKGPISFTSTSGAVNNADDRTGFMVGLRHRF
ncbi:porin [Rivibacter subsaxonicus]|uniref:Putative porin n=1 Tax=Rivibacter subsaxonicus TaxID=457575 RepID=A0A4Q7VGG5_9BURK|nr:porin [Rivibacter subsaxonicus]RZT95120.1 putative porin [Rivibacter subsaxonicus]